MAKKSNSDFVVRYTNKDIMEKLETLHEEQSKTLAQAMQTNGRVTNNASNIKTIRTVVYSAIGVVTTTIIGIILTLI